MKIFCISDPHLSFGTPNKKMDIFGPEWLNHPQKIASAWQNRVSSRDIVLIPGDISWAPKLEYAIPDLKWLDQLPGKKILIPGNHENWWTTSQKVRSILPQSLQILDKDPLQIGAYLFFGVRLWDTSEYDCHDLIQWTTPDGKAPEMYQTKPNDAADKIYDNELRILKDISVKVNNYSGIEKLTSIALTHYPPTNSQLNPSRATDLFEQIPSLKHVVFGHLHQLKKSNEPYFGSKNNIQYHLCSCDYLNFKPKLICGS